MLAANLIAFQFETSNILLEFSKKIDFLSEKPFASKPKAQDAITLTIYLVLMSFDSTTVVPFSDIKFK